MPAAAPHIRSRRPQRTRAGVTMTVHIRPDRHRRRLQSLQAALGGRSSSTPRCAPATASTFFRLFDRGPLRLALFTSSKNSEVFRRCRERGPMSARPAHPRPASHLRGGVVLDTAPSTAPRDQRALPPPSMGVVWRYLCGDDGQTGACGLTQQPRVRWGTLSCPARRLDFATALRPKRPRAEVVPLNAISSASAQRTASSSTSCAVALGRSGHHPAC